MTTYERALQIYQVLICASHHRQTLTYEAVGKKVRLPPHALANHLDHLLRYCQNQNLPHLTVLVVGKETGVPSTGFPSSIEADEERERVFNHEWFAMKPLTPSILKELSS